MLFRLISILAVSLLFVGCSTNPKSKTTSQLKTVKISSKKSAKGVPSGLKPKEIKTVVDTNFNQIEKCHEKYAQDYPKVSGIVEIKFIIGSTGKVVSSKVVEDSLGNEDINKCIIKKTLQWMFPKPRGGKNVTVLIPFAFFSKLRKPHK